MMKVAVKSDLKSKTFCFKKSYTRSIEKETNNVSFKFYQKLFVLFTSFFVILIFPESPKELGNICEIYNSREMCNIW